MPYLMNQNRKVDGSKVFLFRLRSVFDDVNNAESVDINADTVRRKPQTQWRTIGSAVLVSANLTVRLQLSQRVPSCFSQKHVEEFCSMSAFI